MTKKGSSTQSGTPPIDKKMTKKQRKCAVVAVNAKNITVEDPFISMDIKYIMSPHDRTDVNNTTLQ